MGQKANMNDTNEIDGVLEDDSPTTAISVSAAAALNRSDVEAQIAAAHMFPRNIKRFLKDAQGMVTMTRSVAKSCLYALPRAGKVIPGPSVRLAEISASAYGNLHIAARVMEAEAKEVVSQGVCWDLEKNVRITIEARRRITDRSGNRYNDDMITMTGNAAASVGLRNAVFRVIPRSYIDWIYDKARTCAIGDGQTLPEQRDDAFATLLKMGITEDRVLLRVGRPSVQDVTLADLEILVGLMSAIRDGGERAEKMFPAKLDETGTEAPKSVLDKLADRAAKKAAAASAPTHAPAVLLCAVCEQPVTEGVSTLKADGSPGIRHKDCRPIIRSREPGEEG